MYKNKRILALIPARGKSKGLPGKNIKSLSGKPLISWTIEAAKKCKYIDRIIVSTDDKAIADVSEKYGAEVPFRRPQRLAGDRSPTIDTVIHAINWFERRKEFFDIVCLLEPTSPLRDSEDIEGAIRALLAAPGARSIVGISETISCHPMFTVALKKGNFIDPLFNRTFKTQRRQDLKKMYFYEGSLYIAFTGSLHEKRSFYHDKTIGYVMPKWKSYEIDDWADFIIVQSLMDAKQKGKLK